MLAGGQGGDKEGKEGSISKVLYYWLPLPQKHSWQVGHTAPTLPASQPCGVTAPRTVRVDQKGGCICQGPLTPVYHWSLHRVSIPDLPLSYDIQSLWGAAGEAQCIANDASLSSEPRSAGETTAFIS